MRAVGRAGSLVFAQDLLRLLMVREARPAVDHEERYLALGEVLNAVDPIPGSTAFHGDVARDFGIQLGGLRRLERDRPIRILELYLRKPSLDACILPSLNCGQQALPR